MKKKNIVWFFTLVATSVLLMITNSCKEDLLVLTTSDVNDITHAGAVCGGNIASDGGETITERGVCWSTGQHPTIDSSKTIDGSGMGSFTSMLSGLKPLTVYFVRAYAINSIGAAYGNEISFMTLAIPGKATDADGNVYDTVIIDTQVWMKENLKTTKYNDGSDIGKDYSWYDNDITYKNPYGALYTWYAINTGKLCPAGWHVPSDGEWLALTEYLGGESVAGGKLKEVGYDHWISPNNGATGATDEFGFTALPGGRFICWHQSGGQVICDFHGLGYDSYWWSATEESAENSICFYLTWDDSFLRTYGLRKGDLHSVRCVLD
jgi:uncharacterized protein (TIGR02145 family)